MTRKKTVVVQKDKEILTLVLNRPEKLNALSLEMKDDILESFREIQKDKEARVMVLCGAGRCFSAGGDMETMQIVQQSALAADMGARSYLDVVLAIRSLDIPTIAKINGDAYGGGACIALACDFKIASEEAKLGFAFLRVALSGADAGATYLLPRMVGINKAIELLMLGQVINAQEAVKIGLIHKTVPASELDGNVDELAKRLASGPPVALRLTKRALWNSLDRDILSEFDFEAYAQGVCFQTEDHKEGVKAFLEKRSPIFEGR
ncbi:MAG: enoyl-CoA hydratase [Chloroflexi bacterium]|nr:enoyl-CoA hydratase [Chloroflexota bacterium]MBM3182520.1 enoyl-CoA hydratase [Chloroflexota bacterium]MBM4451075.1 enoyl-CoA hydratase [Chloroflexota bacterium]